MKMTILLSHKEASNFSKNIENYYPILDRLVKKFKTKYPNEKISIDCKLSSSEGIIKADIDSENNFNLIIWDNSLPNKQFVNFFDKRVFKRELCAHYILVFKSSFSIFEKQFKL